MNIQLTYSLTVKIALMFELSYFKSFNNQFVNSFELNLVLFYNIQLLAKQHIIEILFDI